MRHGSVGDKQEADSQQQAWIEVTARAHARRESQLKQRKAVGSNFWRSLKEEHPVLSIYFCEDPHFTRVERVTVLLCALMGNMCVEALLYNEETGDSFGEVNYSPTDASDAAINSLSVLLFGLLAALVIAPCALMLATLFRIAAKKRKKSELSPELVEVYALVRAEVAQEYSILLAKAEADEELEAANRGLLGRWLACGYALRMRLKKRRLHRHYDLHRQSEVDHRVQLRTLDDEGRVRYLEDQELLGKMSWFKRRIYKALFVEEVLRPSKRHRTINYNTLAFALSGVWCAWCTFYVLMFGLYVDSDVTPLWFKSFALSLVIDFMLLTPIAVFSFRAIVPAVGTYIVSGVVLQTVVQLSEQAGSVGALAVAGGLAVAAAGAAARTAGRRVSDIANRLRHGGGEVDGMAAADATQGFVLPLVLYDLPSHPKAWGQHHVLLSSNRLLVFADAAQAAAALAEAPGAAQPSDVLVVRGLSKWKGVKDWEAKVVGAKLTCDNGATYRAAFECEGDRSRVLQGITAVLGVERGLASRKGGGGGGGGAQTQTKAVEVEMALVSNGDGNGNGGSTTSGGGNPATTWV